MEMRREEIADVDETFQGYLKGIWRETQRENIFTMLLWPEVCAPLKRPL